MLGLLNYWDEISQSYKEFPVLQGTPANPYPVGSIYMSIAATSPAELFGGTWERIMDKFLIGASDTYVPETEGGEAAVTLDYMQMPAHNHQSMWYDANGPYQIPTEYGMYHINTTAVIQNALNGPTWGGLITFSTEGGGTQQPAALSCRLYLAKN